MGSKPRNDLTAGRVWQLLHYEPETGVFVRLVSKPKCPAGSIAGVLNDNGYWLISVDGAKYRAHRLAWLWMTGEWPAGEIDHRDGVRHNNRWGNLRDVTTEVNQQNQRKSHTDSKTGLLGASPAKGGFKAQILIGNRDVYLGLYKTPEEAHAAYVRAKRLLHEGATL
jgi:hypothetical protein